MLPSLNTLVSCSTWSLVLPYTKDPCPLASVLTMPPIVALSLVDNSGAKNKLCFAISSFS